MNGEPAATSNAPPVAGPARSALAETPLVRRLVGVVIAAPAAAVLGLAAYLTPSPAGLGTHEQLRMPACGWVTLMDLPCPTCGMTTSFSHAADGHLLQSFLTQPMGFVLAVLTAMGLLAGVYVAITGSSLLSMAARCYTARIGWLAAAGVLLAWGYKIMTHRGLL